MGKEIVKVTYSITKSLPSSESFGLITQMNRAAISIPSNIAEGCGRSSKKEKLHFLVIAYASLMELMCQYEILMEFEYIDQQKYQGIVNQIEKLSVKLNNFRQYIKDSAAR